MAVEAGSETGLFPADEAVARYLDGRTARPWAAEVTDPDAAIAASTQIDLGAGPPLSALDAGRPRRVAAADRAPSLSRQRRTRRRRLRAHDRPGLHRQLRQRD